MSDNTDDARGTSEKRQQALQMQMQQRQFVQRLAQRGERIKDAESTPLEMELRSKLWWECTVSGTITCVGTFALLRRRAGTVVSALGGTLVGNLTFGGVFAQRVETFFEKICAQPERSARVDSLLCPTFLEMKSMMSGEPPPKATRIWELCEARAERFGSGGDGASSNGSWTGGGDGASSDDGWSSPGEGDWSSPPKADDDRCGTPLPTRQNRVTCVFVLEQAPLAPQPVLGVHSLEHGRLALVRLDDGDEDA